MFSFQYRGVQRVCSRGQDDVHHCVIQALPALHIKAGETSVVQLRPPSHFFFYHTLRTLPLLFLLYHPPTRILMCHFNLIHKYEFNIRPQLINLEAHHCWIDAGHKSLHWYEMTGFSLPFLTIFIPNANVRHHPFKNLPEEMHLKRTQFCPQPFFALFSKPHYEMNRTSHYQSVTSYHR